MTTKTTSGVNGPPLRIAYLIQQFPLPTETFAVSDIASLLGQGHQVRVYTMRMPRRNERALRIASRVPVELEVDRPSLSGGLAWPLLLWRYRSIVTALFGRIVRELATQHFKTALQAIMCVPRVLEIAHNIKEGRYDVVHVFWARHVGLVLPALQQMNAGVLRTSFLGTHDLVADDFLADLTVKAAEVVFSHAEVNRPSVEERAPRNAPVEIIRRGVPLPQLDGRHPRDRFRLVTASSLIPQKNVGAVIRAFAHLREHEPRSTLDVFGDGPCRGELQRLCRSLGCAEAVRFMGHVSRDELFTEMQKAELFLFLSKSKWDRLPNVLKEAMWAGCAVVSSNTDGIEELIPDARVGLVVDPDDERAVQGAISALLSASPADRAERRQQAQAIVAEHYSTKSSMQAYSQVWRGALNRRRLRELSLPSTSYAGETPAAEAVGQPVLSFNKSTARK